MPVYIRAIAAILACVLVGGGAAWARQTGNAGGPGAWAPGGVGVRASVQSEQMYVGQTQHLSIQWSGADDARPPDLSPITDFDIGNMVTSTNSGFFSITINGRQVQSQQGSRSFQYDIRPRRAGELTIPALTVFIAGQPYTTEPITIRVIEPATSEDARLDVRLDASEAYVGQPLRMTVTWAFAGVPYQPVIDVPSPAGCDVLPGPDPRPTGVRPNDPRFIALQVGREQVIAVLGNALVNNKPGKTVTFERIVIPREPGTLTIGPSRVDYSVPPPGRPASPFDLIFDQTPMERRVCRAPASMIPIRALPPGAPANFSGLVGAYAIAAEAGVAQASVGEPIPLRVSVTGPAPLSLVPPLDLRRQSTFDPAEFRVPRAPVLGDERGNAVWFETSVRARGEGTRQIPPIELTYFDPQSAAYQTARTSPIALTILPNTNAGLPADVDAPDDVEGAAAPGLPTIDRRPPTPADWLDWPVRMSEPLAVALLGAPVIAYALLMVVVSAVRASRLHPEARRRRRAAKVALARLDQAERKEPEAGIAQIGAALREFIGDALERNGAAMTSLEAAHRVREVPHAQVFADEVHAVLNRCDAACFGNGGTTNETAQLAARARVLVRRMDSALRRAPREPISPREPRRMARPEAVVAGLALAASLGFAHTARGSTNEPATQVSSAWDSALAAFDRGVARQTASGASRTADFEKAAAEFERVARDPRLSLLSRARAWQNAGIAALQAGRAPQAVLNLRRARSLAPNAPGLEAALAEARLKVESNAGFDRSDSVRDLARDAERLSLFLPRGAWFVILLSGLTLRCALGAVQGLRNRPITGSLRAWALLTGTITVIAGVGLYSHVHSQRRTDEAVVMTSVPVRTGPDDLIFEIGAPVRAGEEVRIVEQRVAPTGQIWFRIQRSGAGEVGSSGQAWVPAGAVERIQG